MIHFLFAALLWLSGAVAVLLVGLCLSPIRLKAGADSLHCDEETPIDWDEVVFRAQVSGLLGAVQARLERRDGNMRAEWRLFGITKSIRRQDAQNERHAARGPAKSKPTLEPEGAAKTESKPKSSRTSPINLFVLRRLLPDAQWLLKKALRRLKFNVRGALAYGFSDPFATAVVHGLTGALPPLPELELQPDYAQGTLNGWVELSLRMYPLQALLLIVQACFRPGVRSLWWPRLRNRIIPRRIKEVLRT